MGVIVLILGVTRAGTKIAVEDETVHIPSVKLTSYASFVGKLGIVIDGGVLEPMLENALPVVTEVAVALTGPIPPVKSATIDPRAPAAHVAGSIPSIVPGVKGVVVNATGNGGTISAEIPVSPLRRPVAAPATTNGAWKASQGTAKVADISTDSPSTRVPLLPVSKAAPDGLTE